MAAPPEALSIEVTRRCIARCLMCNIWCTPAPLPELTVGEWLRLLEAPALSGLRELDITGGEPFLRDDLVDLVQGVLRLKRAALPLLRTVAITTNGVLTDKILSDVGRLLPALEEGGITLVFACGMDAIGEQHDRIRRLKGAWSKLDATLERLRGVRQRHPFLVLGVKTTVSRHNIDELPAVYRYARERGLFTIISPYILTSNRYNNASLGEALALGPPEVEKLKAFYRAHDLGWSSYVAELLEFLETGRMKKPCSAGFNYLFVNSAGELFPCPIISYPLGNLRQAPLADLVCSAKARSFRRNVLKFQECATCTEPGIERYSLAFEGLHYLRYYLSAGREKFLDLHGHLGLDKYFSR